MLVKRNFQTREAHRTVDVFWVVPDYNCQMVFFAVIDQLLIKLPPLFPDAAPDMFWSVHVRLDNGNAPQGTSTESSWNPTGNVFRGFAARVPGGAGISTLRDYMRCNPCPI